jgi:LDH2 family malate/lactate/ureidoglycolate dehydrogenase
MVDERFRVPEDIAVRVQVDTIRPVVEGIFRAHGMPEADAKQSADTLLYADLHGIDSHGISNMMPHYERWIEGGEINVTPEPKTVREAPATVTIDADRALGLAIGPRAMQEAMNRAETCGIGAAAVVNSNHFGACAYHAAMALERDMIGVVMTTTGCITLPTFGAEPRLGTNPIGVAAPTGTEVPFLFDASVSSQPQNKVHIAKRLGAMMAPGWIARPDGTPILEEAPVPDEFFILPLGATREGGSHKGYGLAVMADILSGLLAGGSPSYEEAPPVSHHFLAYRIDAFTDVEEFKRGMDRFMKLLRETPPAPGCDRVLYAGMPEHETAVERRKSGIPYHPEVIEWYREAASRHGVPFPAI